MLAPGQMKRDKIGFLDNRPENLVQQQMSAMMNAGRGVIQRTNVSGTEVILEGGYPTFFMSNKKYHLNEEGFEQKKKTMILVGHVTCDSEGRKHYYYKKTDNGFENRGGIRDNNKGTWGSLDNTVRTWVENNYDTIVKVTEKGTISITDGSVTKTK